jgi:hypothetical protein
MIHVRKTKRTSFCGEPSAGTGFSSRADWSRR